jgi:hypothetical protein
MLAQISQSEVKNTQQQQRVTCLYCRYVQRTDMCEVVTRIKLGAAFGIFASHISEGL